MDGGRGLLSLWCLLRGCTGPRFIIIHMGTGITSIGAMAIASMDVVITTTDIAIIITTTINQVTGARRRIE